MTLTPRRSSQWKDEKKTIMKTYAGRSDINDYVNKVVAQLLKHKSSDHK